MLYDYSLISEQMELITFNIDEQMYAIPLLWVYGIVNQQEIENIFYEPLICGTINIKGLTIPVINRIHKFGSKFCGDFNNANSRILLVEISNKAIGLVIDSIPEVASVKHKEVENITEISENVPSFIWATINHNSKEIMIINPDLLLTPDEVQTLSLISRIRDLEQTLETG